MRSRVGAGGRTVAAVTIVTVMTAAAIVALYYAPVWGGGTSQGGLVVTADASTYFPHGYISHVMNFTATRSGDGVVVGNYSFLYVTPSNLETRTMSVGTSGQSSTTVVVVTAEYQCGVSLGQRRLFFAQPLASGVNATFRLDYCLLVNTAIAQGALQGGVARAWDLWQVSAGSTPAVALHMTGSGEGVSLVELCVGK
ncbi:MAG TPA: hypothetical protein VJR06_05860 [Nitrososphaerales archaeon]|nr:hypothetical protein [Nitrososphaerales archaeon]